MGLSAWTRSLTLVRPEISFFLSAAACTVFAMPATTGLGERAERPDHAFFPSLPTRASRKFLRDDLARMLHVVAQHALEYGGPCPDRALMHLVRSLTASRFAEPTINHSSSTSATFA